MKFGTALGASAANGYSRVGMAGLCYDTQPVEVTLFSVDMLNKNAVCLVVRLLSGKTSVQTP